MNGANSLSPEKIIDLTNQLFEITKSESIPPAEVRVFTKQILEQNQRLDEQIQEAESLLQSKNVNMKTIIEYTRLKEHLSKHNLSLEDTARLVSILQTIKQIGYEPKKIVAAFTSMKSLRQEERSLKSNCTMLESRMVQCREALPMCEQIVRLGVGIPELLALHAAVIKKADTDNLSLNKAAYRVVDEIRDYNVLGGMKKQLYEVGMKIFMMNQMSAPLNKAIMTLMRLQADGITDD